MGTVGCQNMRYMTVGSFNFHWHLQLVVHGKCHLVLLSYSDHPLGAHLVSWPGRCRDFLKSNGRMNGSLEAENENISLSVSLKCCLYLEVFYMHSQCGNKYVRLDDIQSIIIVWFSIYCSHLYIFMQHILIILNKHIEHYLTGDAYIFNKCVYSTHINCCNNLG